MIRRIGAFTSVWLGEVVFGESACYDANGPCRNFFLDKLLSANLEMDAIQPSTYISRYVLTCTYMHVGSSGS